MSVLKPSGALLQIGLKLSCAIVEGWSGPVVEVQQFLYMLSVTILALFWNAVIYLRGYHDNASSVHVLQYLDRSQAELLELLSQFVLPKPRACFRACYALVKSYSVWRLLSPGAIHLRLTIIICAPIRHNRHQDCCNDIRSSDARMIYIVIVATMILSTISLDRILALHLGWISYLMWNGTVRFVSSCQYSWGLGWFKDRG